MRVQVLTHVPFEGPAAISGWISDRGFSRQAAGLFQGDPLPAPDDLDLLFVMGGPMGAYETSRYPWLSKEKHFIERVLQSGKKIVGICLGAQLIAEVLGARVKRNPQKEIGWFPVKAERPVPAPHIAAAGLSSASAPEAILSVLPASFPAFHWHGDTFELPRSAVRLASSEACENQAFLAASNILALQFHLESTPESVEALIAHGAGEIVPGPFIQDAATLRRLSREYAPATARLLRNLLDSFVALE